MNSRFLLKFNDPETLADYNKQRRSDIIKVSALLLAERILYFVILIINSFLHSSVTKLRLIINSIAVISHILLLLTLKFPSTFVYTIHGPLIILSHMFHLLNPILSEDQLIATSS